MDRKELKREMVEVIYEAWDYYANKKQLMGSPEASRIAEAIITRLQSAGIFTLP